MVHRSFWMLPVLAIASACPPPDPKPEPDPVDVVCGGNTLPRAPTVTSPQGEGVDPAGLEVTWSAFVDADGDAHAGTEVEIWREKGGALNERAWSAVVDGDATSVALADGTFEGKELEQIGGGLEDDQDYIVRVRVRDDVEPSAGCDTFGPWSTGSVFRTLDPSDALFDPAVVRTLEIELPEASIEAMNAQAQPPGCVQFPRDYQPGTFRFDDEVYENVGVRIKGGCGSSRSLNEKASLKISFNPRFGDACSPVERRFMGQKALTLNNGVQDPSGVHERLGYEVYRVAGVPAPRTASVRVVVNGELYGLYTLVETPGRRFLSRFFENNDGMMYEGAYFCDFIEDNIPRSDDEFSCFQREFDVDECDVANDNRDPTDFSLLRGLTQEIEALQNGPGFYPGIRQLIDWDNFLSMWAVDAVIDHWDGYTFYIVNNYRVYRDPDEGLWHFIPWGIDQTFDGGQNVSPFDSSALLVQRCLDDDACEADFIARLEEVTTLFERMSLPEDAAALAVQLAPYVEEDPRREYDFGSWQDRQQAVQGFIADRPAQIRDAIANRQP